MPLHCTLKKAYLPELEKKKKVYFTKTGSWLEPQAIIC